MLLHDGVVASDHIQHDGFERMHTGILDAREYCMQMDTVRHQHATKKLLVAC